MSDDLRLAKLGLAMRAAQRAYFRTRSRSDLIASKDLEKSFDAACQAAMERAGMGQLGLEITEDAA